MHTHIPECCNTNDITSYIIDKFVIVIDNSSAIKNLPVTQQRFRKATLRIFQQTCLLLQILLMKSEGSPLPTHLIIVHKYAEPLVLSTF